MQGRIGIGRVILALTACLLNGCAIHGMLAKSKGQVPKVELKRTEKLVFVYSTQSPEHAAYAEYLASRFRNAEVKHLTPEAAGGRYGGDSGAYDYAFRIEGLEIRNISAGLGVLGWERLIKYSARITVLDPKAGTPLETFNSNGFCLNNGFGTGFEELSFENQVEYDVGSLKEKIRRRVEVARDNALQDASGKIFKALKYDMREVSPVRVNSISGRVR